MHVVLRFPRRHRGRLVAAVTVAAAAVVLAASLAAGEPGNGTPEMQVLPSPDGVDYRQTVQVRADDLPEGSGLIAATICGLTDAAGEPIATPGADDCAGADELGRGLVVLQENRDGTFDQPYTLPASGETFGKNGRFCDATHRCALVVADANPEAPAYYLSQVLRFVDQAPLGGSTPEDETTTTTAPPPPSARASGATVRVGETLTVSGEHWIAGDPDTYVGFVDGTGNRTTTPVAATIDSDGSFTVNLTAQFDDLDANTVVVEDLSADPTTHRIAIPIDVEPQPGVSGTSRASASVSPEPRVEVRARVVIEPPSGDDAPLPPAVAGTVADACAAVAQQLAGAGADTTALVTACRSVTEGGGAQQLELLLRQPSLLCIALAPAAGNNPEFVSACSELLGSGGAGQATPPLADALSPLLATVP